MTDILRTQSNPDNPESENEHHSHTPLQEHPDKNAGEAAKKFNLDAVKAILLNPKAQSVLHLCASLVLLLFTVGLVGYYTIFPSRGYFHSDCTDTLMWAQASYDGKTLFNPDFTYACLLPFGTSLIMLLLMPFTGGVTMATHVAGMFCFFILFTAAFLYMLRQMKWGWGWIAVSTFTLLMFCSASTKLREIFWGHTIYYSLGVLFIFVGLGLLFRRMNLLDKLEITSNFSKLQKFSEMLAQHKKHHVHLTICMACILLWFVLTCSNQVIAITIFALPVMAAVFCERWLDSSTRPLSAKNLDSLLVFLVMGVGMVIGYVATMLIAEDIPTPYADSFSCYSEMGTWADHVRLFPTAWLSLLGVEIKDGQMLVTPESVQQLLMIIAGILLLLLPVLALFCYGKIEDRKLRILILTYWFMTILIMMGYILGKLSVANWRLSPIVAMSAVVSVAFLRWGISQIAWQRLLSLCVIPLLLVSSFHAAEILEMKPGDYAESTLYKLSVQLKDLGLTYGYGTFWQANGLTVVSDSQIKCRDIDVGIYGCFPRSYQSNVEWYQDQPGQEKYFLLLHITEIDTLQGSTAAFYTEPHEVHYLADGFQAWVYDHNIVHVES